jgi:hypothetical protein
MVVIHEQYIVDKKDHKKSVIISIHEWQKIQEILKAYESMRVPEKPKSRKFHPISFGKILKKLKKDGKN